MQDQHPTAARWLAGVLLGSGMTAISGLGSVVLVHEHRLSAVEVRQEDSRQQLDRIEKKLDRLAQQQHP